MKIDPIEAVQETVRVDVVATEEEEEEEEGRGGEGEESG